MAWKQINPANKMTLKYMRITHLMKQALEPYMKMHIESLERVVKIRNAVETRRRKSSLPAGD